MPSGYHLSIGETECISSPKDRYMLEVRDCYVIADTLRFFSKNDGAFCLFLRRTEAFLQLKLYPPFSEHENFGDVRVRVRDWNSE